MKSGAEEMQEGRLTGMTAMVTVVDSCRGYGMSAEHSRRNHQAEGEGRAGDRPPSEVAGDRCGLPSQAPYSALEQIIPVESDRALYHCLLTPLGQAQDRRCEIEWAIPRRIIVGEDFDFICEVVGELSERRHPEKRARQEPISRDPEWIPP